MMVPTDSYTLTLSWWDDMYNDEDDDGTFLNEISIIITLNRIVQCSTIGFASKSKLYKSLVTSILR